MKKAFIQLHISILIAGTTGLFGRLVSLNEGLLVWYRMFFAAILLYIVLWFSHRLEKTTWREILKIAGAGLLLGSHWVFFFGSI